MSVNSESRKIFFKRITETGVSNGVHYSFEYPVIDNKLLFNSKRKENLGIESPYLDPSQLPRDVVASFTGTLDNYLSKNPVSGLNNIKIPMHGLNIFLDITFNAEKEGFGNILVKATVGEMIGYGVGEGLIAITGLFFPVVGITSAFLLGMVGGFFSAWISETIFYVLNSNEGQERNHDNGVEEEKITSKLEKVKESIRESKDEKEKYKYEQKSLRLEFRREEYRIRDYNEVTIKKEIDKKEKIIEKIETDMALVKEKKGRFYDYKLLNYKLYNEKNLYEFLLKRRTAPILNKIDSLKREVKDNLFINTLLELVEKRRDLVNLNKYYKNQKGLANIISDVGKAINTFEITNFKVIYPSYVKETVFLANVFETLNSFNKCKKQKLLEKFIVYKLKIQILNEVLLYKKEYWGTIDYFLNHEMKKKDHEIKTLTRDYFTNITQQYKDWKRWEINDNRMSRYSLAFKKFTKRIEKEISQSKSHISTLKKILNGEIPKINPIVADKNETTKKINSEILRIEALKIIKKNKILSFDESTISKVIADYGINKLLKKHEEEKEFKLNIKNIINKKIDKVLSYKFYDFKFYDFVDTIDFLNLGKIDERMLRNDLSLLERLYQRITYFELNNKYADRKIDKHEYKKEIRDKNFERSSKKNENTVDLNEKKQALLKIQQKLIFKLNSTDDYKERKILKFDLLRISQVLYGGTLDPKIQGLSDSVGVALYEYVEAKETQINLNRDIVLRELLKQEKDVVSGKSIKERVEEKMKNLSEAEYWDLVKKGIDHNKKVKEVLDYIWTNPNIEKDPLKFNEENLQYDMTLFNKYYNKMMSERKGQRSKTNEDQKEILKQIDSLSLILENHKKNILIHNKEINVADNSVNRGPQIFA